MMGGSIATATVLLATSVVRLYDLSVATTNGGPGIASEVPAKFVMDHLFERGNIGLATAAATSMLATLARAGAVVRLATSSQPEDGTLTVIPSGRRPKHLTPARMCLCAFLVISAAFFLAHLPRDHVADGGADHRRRHDPAGNRYLE